MTGGGVAGGGGGGVWRGNNDDGKGAAGLTVLQRERERNSEEVNGRCGERQVMYTNKNITRISKS